MPSTVNGVGTTYRNESNVVHRPGNCQKCGKYDNLASYDTELWFVILFIPIYRIKRVHIINYCPSCTVHSAIDKEDWDKMRTEGIATLLKKYRENPRDGRAAVELLQAADFYQDDETYNKVSQEVQETLSENVDVMLYLASLHLEKNEIADAMKLYDRVLEIDSYNFEAHRIKLLIAVDEADINTAENHAKVLIDQGAVQYVHALIPLVHLYQTQGKHEKALELLEDIESLEPGYQNEKDFINLKEVSQANQGSGKSVKAKKFEYGRAEKERKRRNAILAGVVIVAGIASIYLAYCFILGSQKRLWLMNGTDYDYTILLDGKPVELVSGEVLPVKAGLGSHLIEPVENSIPEPIELEMEENFFTRPFSKREFFSNPDQIGTLLLVRVFYAPGNSAPEPQVQSYPAPSFQLLNQVHFPFEDTPETISTSRRSGVESRSTTTFLPFRTAIRAAGEYLTKEQKANLFRLWAAKETDTEVIADLLEISLPAPQIVEYTSSYMEEHGLDISLLKAQNMALAEEDRLEEAEDLTMEFIGRYPDDDYLATCELDFIQSESEYEQRVRELRSKFPDSIFINNIYAALLIKSGDLDKGIEIYNTSDEAMEFGQWEFYEALIMSKEYSRLIEFFSPYPDIDYYDLVALSHMMSGEEGSTLLDVETLNNFVGGNDSLKKFVVGSANLEQGDEENALTLLEESYMSMPEAYIIRSELGQASESARHLQEVFGHSLRDILIHVAALEAGNNVIADSWKDDATKALRQCLDGATVLESMITEEAPLDLEVMKDLRLSRNYKPLALLWLSCVYPEQKEEIHAAIDLDSIPSISTRRAVETLMKK